MVMNVHDAGNIAKALGQPQKAGMETKSNGGPTFGQMLEGTLQGAIDSQYKSEAMTKAAISGKADMSDVISAVTQADLTLNTVVAIRDRVVAAYNQIMRMPI